MSHFYVLINLLYNDFLQVIQHLPFRLEGPGPSSFSPQLIPVIIKCPARVGAPTLEGIDLQTRLRAVGVPILKKMRCEK